jgi:alkylation response protein AidB-like acyl-CoA dehydrogenase
MAAAIVFDGEAPVVTDGLLEIRAGVFPIEQARNLDTWHVTGMQATGSNEYAFDGVEVDAGWTFEPLRPEVGSSDVFSCIPLWAQLGAGLAANAVGAARNMIERFTNLAATKIPTGGNFSRLAERPPAQIALGEAQGLYQAARAVLAETVRSNWERGVARLPFDNDVLARQRLGTVTAVRLAAHAIDLLHDAAGMNAVARDSVLDRCWRDVHTITQHIILSPARFEIAGRVLMGLDPQSPII